MKFASLIFVIFLAIASSYFLIPGIVFDTRFRDPSNVIPGLFIGFFSLLFLNAYSRNHELGKSLAATVLMQAVLFLVVVFLFKFLPRA